MGSPEHPNWFLDCPLIDDMPVPETDFAAPTGGLNWNPQGFNPYPDVSVEINGSIANSDGHKEPGSQKRMRSESCSGPSSKACREKMRRDRLNERFLDLSSILDPGKPPKMDKATILNDAVHMVTQLRTEAQKLKESNESLQDKINELKLVCGKHLTGTFLTARGLHVNWECCGCIGIVEDHDHVFIHSLLSQFWGTFSLLGPSTQPSCLKWMLPLPAQLSNF